MARARAGIRVEFRVGVWIMFRVYDRGRSRCRGRHCYSSTEVDVLPETTNASPDANPNNLVHSPPRSRLRVIIDIRISCCLRVIIDIRIRC